MPARQDASGRWRDATGRFIAGAWVYTDGSIRDPRGRFVSPPTPRPAKKSRGRLRAERTEERIANARRLAASRRTKQWHVRVRAYIRAVLGEGRELTYRQAQRELSGSLGDQMKAAYNSPIRNIRYRKGRAFRKSDGKELSPRQVFNMRQRAVYEEIVWRISIRRGISYATARRRIKERYGGNWRAAMRRELYGKGG